MAKWGIDMKTGRLSKESTAIVGIDLGTTNSLVAYMQQGQPVCLKHGQNLSTLVPSVIYIDAQEKLVVGAEAHEARTTFPERCIFSVKRLIGKRYQDVQNQLDHVPYRVIDSGPDAMVKVQVGDTFYSPVYLSSKILEYLREAISTQINEPVVKAVITVPAYFNDVQRQATRDAGKLAGWDVLRIINEPTAASLAYGYGLGNDENKTIVVFDLGGGTFDLSILKLQNGIFEVIATHGDTLLGGDDFDQCISQLLQTRLQKLQVDISMSELGQYSRKVKIALSASDSVTLDIQNHSITITREEFEVASVELLDRITQCCQFAIKDAQVGLDQFDEIILVGGATRMPMIRTLVKNIFHKEPNTSQNPDEAVALGAAIQADILAGNRPELLLLDVTPLSLGIETMGGIMDIIIERNSKIPCSFARNYTTSVDGQANLRISVFQGERELVQHNRQLGTFHLKNIPPMPAGIPKIQVTFMMNVDGILRVAAKELRSGTEQTVEVKPTYGITEEEMALMLIDSIQHASTDVQNKEVIEAVNEAKNVLFFTEKLIRQNENYISPDERNLLAQCKIDIEDSIKTSNKDLIQATLQNVNTKAQPIAHRLMEQSIQRALQGTHLTE